MTLLSTKYYDLPSAMWPDLTRGYVPLSPVRVGMDRKTGKMLIGWPHVWQSLTLIFLTRFHVRVLRRWVGSFVPHALGEDLTERTILNFFWAIATSIDLWEPNYSVQRVLFKKNSQDDTINSVSEIRSGKASVQTQGVYRPRGHLGDPTPASRGLVRFTGRGTGLWEARG